MKTRNPMPCLDCQATDSALARRAYQRRVLALVTAALLGLALLVAIK